MEETYINSFLIILIFFVIIISISFYVKTKIKRNFNKNNNKASHCKFTGVEVAKKLLINNWVRDVEIIETEKLLSDSYDPKNKAIYLSKAIYNGNSISAISVAAHEVGHALQHKENYIFMRLALLLFPIADFGASMSWIFLLFGLLFAELERFFFIGVFLLLIAFLYQLINIPIEINASKRALQLLSNNNLILDEERKQVKEVLTTASHTYAAAPAIVLTEIYNAIRRRFKW